MAASDDLDFSFMDFPTTFGAFTECEGKSSMMVSENIHNDFVDFIPVSAATNDVYHSPLIHTNTDQETVIVTQNQRFHHKDDYSKNFNTAENFRDMSSYVFSNGQRENVCSKMMTIGLQSTDSQHGFLEQSYQQPLVTQTIPQLAIEPYVFSMVNDNLQEVEKANGPTNFDLIHDFQDHHFHPSLYQEGQYDHNDKLLEQLMRIHENNNQMQLSKFSNRTTPIVETFLKNQCQFPLVSIPDTITNPEYHTPMITDTRTTHKKSSNLSPFTHTSYQPDPFANGFRNSSSLNPTRRPRGRPRRHQSSMPSSLPSTTPKNMSLLPTTQTLLAPHMPYCAQEKEKQQVTAMPPLNPALYNHYQNQYKNSMFQQSGNLKQRRSYDQFENEDSSSKIRRVMIPFQEKSISDSSIIPFGQDRHMHSSLDNHHEERLQNTVYDPLYAGVGLPIDPHLRFFD